jgi:hypothetical protein
MLGSIYRQEKFDIIKMDNLNFCNNLALCKVQKWKKIKV